MCRFARPAFGLAGLFFGLGGSKKDRRTIFARATSPKIHQP
jgi:hypothetical protein